MPRIARVVLPGYPLHVTQRSNRRQRVFFMVGDYAHYLELIAQSCLKAQTECLAYCRMPNHVHLVLTPNGETAFIRTAELLNGRSLAPRKPGRKPRRNPNSAGGEAE